MHFATRFGGMPPPPKKKIFFLNGAFCVYFDPILSLKFLDRRLLWGITRRKKIENMLRLMRFGIYFDRILKIKWLFLYRNNYSIATRIYALGAWGPAYVTRKKFENMMQFRAFWCIFYQIVS